MFCQGRFFVTDILLFVVIALLVAVVIVLFMLFRKSSQADSSVLASRLDGFEKSQERIERAVREEVAQNRDELGKSAKDLMKLSRRSVIPWCNG
jgi:hypothetical protein